MSLAGRSRLALDAMVTRVRLVLFLEPLSQIGRQSNIPLTPRMTPKKSVSVELSRQERFGNTILHTAVNG